MQKISKARLAKAHQTFAAYMQKVGAAHEPAHTAYRWKIETPLGLVYLSMHDDSTCIFVRFDDPARVKQHLTDMRLNRHSGKWNWHGLTPLDDPFEAFKLEFDDILTMDVAPPALAD
jgi:hypothetical protein